MPRRRSFLPDLLRPGLRLAIVGFNPGAVSAARGHYYAKPGNAFYPLLFESGLTPRRLSPEEDSLLPRWGIGLVDLCPWKAGQAEVLTRRDVAEGRRRLLGKLARSRPGLVAFNGLGLFRLVFGRSPRPGPQPERIAGRPTFALPSTSGLVNGRWRERRAAFRRLSALLGQGVPGLQAARDAQRPA